jgi:hypothetical protein
VWQENVIVPVTVLRQYLCENMMVAVCLLMMCEFVMVILNDSDKNVAVFTDGTCDIVKIIFI